MPGNAMSGFGILHLRRLRDRPARLALAVSGIAAGVALVVSILGIYTSILHSVDRLHSFAGAADLEVSTAGGVGVDFDRVSATLDRSDVDAVAPIVRTSVAIDGEIVLLIGADARAVPFAGDLSREFDPAELRIGDGVVLTASMADSLDVVAGESVAVFSPTGGTHDVVVDDVATASGLDSVNKGALAFATLDRAQRLLGRTTVVDSVLVDLADRVDADAVRDELEDVLGPSVLVEERSARRSRIAAPAIIYLSQVGPVAGMALVVGGFLVFSTMNMAAMERRREIATLRTLGATRRRVVFGLLGEAAVIGLVGSVLGVALGRVGAGAVVDALPAAMAQAIGVEVSFSLPMWALGIGLVTGVGAAVAATLAPALRATRDHPLTALRPAGTLASGGEPTGLSWRPFAAGAAMMVIGTLVVVTVRGDRAAGGILLLTIGGVVATYGAAGPIGDLAGRVARLGGGLGHLAASGLHRSPHRVWATSMAVALAVAMTLAVASGARNQLDVDEAHMSNLRTADLVVSPQSLEQLSIDVHLPDDLPQAFGELDGVVATSSMVNVPAVRDGKGFYVFGADQQPGPSSFPLLELAERDVQAAALRGESVIVSHQFAREFDVDTGDQVRLEGSGGSVALPVGQVINTLSVSPNGGVVLAVDHVRSVFESTGWSSIELTLADGVDRSAVRDRVEDHVAGRAFPVVVSTGPEAYDAVIGGITAAIQMMYPILGVVVAIAGLAVLNTLVASILDRWRELGVLRAVGTTPRQLARIITLEAVGVGVVGTAVGLLVGEWVHWAGIRYVGNASPLPAEYGFEPLIVVIAALAGVAATVIGSLAPIRRATRVDVLDAIAWE